MAGQCGTVAVAEDQGLYEAGFVALLKRELSYPQVVTSRSFEQLIGLLENSDIFLVVISTTLPGFEGPSSIRALRLSHPHLRVVVIGGSTARSDILSFLEAGIHGYLCREQSPRDLASALRFVETGHIYLPSSLADADDPEPVPDLPLARDAACALTRRQGEIVELLAAGLSNKTIARLLSISPATVKVHVSAAFRTLGVHDRRSATNLIRPAEATDLDKGSLKFLQGSDRTNASPGIGNC